MTSPETADGLGSPVQLHRSGQGPAIVLVHALGSDRRAADVLAPLLPGYSVISYDLPGHGSRPAPPARYRIRDLANELEAALDAAGIDQVYLVGMSLGGLVVQELAAAFGARVAGSVLADTVARYPEPVRAMWTERAGIARESGLASLVEATLTAWFTDAYLAAGGPQVEATRASLLATPPEGYALACEALEQADTRILLAAIAAPTLVVCGADDMPHFTAAATMLSDTIATAQLQWLAPARHAAILEQPEQFAEMLDRFIAAHPSTDRSA